MEFKFKTIHVVPPFTTAEVAEGVLASAEELDSTTKTLSERLTMTAEQLNTYLDSLYAYAVRLADRNHQLEDEHAMISEQLTNTNQLLGQLVSQASALPKIIEAVNSIATSTTELVAAVQTMSANAGNTVVINNGGTASGTSSQQSGDTSTGDAGMTSFTLHAANLQDGCVYTIKDADSGQYVELQEGGTYVIYAETGSTPSVTITGVSTGSIRLAGLATDGAELTINGQSKIAHAGPPTAAETPAEEDAEFVQVSIFAKNLGNADYRVLDVVNDVIYRGSLMNNAVATFPVRIGSTLRVELVPGAECIVDDSMTVNYGVITTTSYLHYNAAQATTNVSTEPAPEPEPEPEPSPEPKPEDDRPVYYVIYSHPAGYELTHYKAKLGGDKYAWWYEGDSYITAPAKYKDVYATESSNAVRTAYINAGSKTLWHVGDTARLVRIVEQGWTEISRTQIVHRVPECTGLAPAGTTYMYEVVPTTSGMDIKYVGQLPPSN